MKQGVHFSRRARTGAWVWMASCNNKALRAWITDGVKRHRAPLGPEYGWCHARYSPFGAGKWMVAWNPGRPAGRRAFMGGLSLKAAQRGGGHEIASNHPSRSSSGGRVFDISKNERLGLFYFFAVSFSRTVLILSRWLFNAGRSSLTTFQTMSMLTPE